MLINKLKDSILNDINDMVLTVSYNDDQQLIIDYINNAVDRMLGLEVEEVLRKEISILMSEKGSDEIYRFAKSEGDYIEDVLEFKTTDHVFISFKVAVNKITIENKVYISLICLDTREKNLLVDRLRHTKDLFDNLFNNSDDSIFVINQVMQITGYNDVAKVVFSLDEVHDDLHLVYNLFQGDEQLEAKIQDSFALGFSNFRYEFETKEGTKYLRFLVNEIQCQEKPKEYFVIITDESDIIHSRKTTMLYRKIFEEIEEGVLITDIKGEIIWANQSIYNQSGYSMSDLIGAGPSLFKSGRQDETFYQNMWEEIREHDRYEGELWNQSKAGRIYPIRLSILKMDSVFDQEFVYIGIVKDLSDEKNLENKLNAMNIKDRLTKLYNRYYIEDAITSLIGQGSRFAAISFEVDEFKRLNELKGHDHGDKVLQDVANKLTFVFADGIIGRIGADEFVVIIEYYRFAKIEEAIYKFFLMLHPQGQQLQQGFNYSMTAGVVKVEHTDIKMNQILNHVSIAKEEARRQRGNSFVVYSDEMASKVHYSVKMEEALVEAVANKDFTLVYQPIFDVTNDRFAGVEALIRWEHKNYGFIPPSVFIPIAEQNGLINEIGHFVIEQCCSDYPIINNYINNTKKAFVAINMSPLQFEQSDIVGRIEYMCSKYDLEPDLFEIEITESSYMTNIDYFLEVTSEFRKVGFAVVVDDFGTGYSSLNRLVELEIDKVKIDKSFIDRIGETKKYEELIEVIKIISSTLELDVVAEGVEYEYQYNFIKELGIKYVQGYYKSRPMKIADMHR